jgi:hypothetical protein
MFSLEAGKRRMDSTIIGSEKGSYYDHNVNIALGLLHNLQYFLHILLTYEKIVFSLHIFFAYFCRSACVSQRFVGEWRGFVDVACWRRLLSLLLFPTVIQFFATPVRVIQFAAG